METRVRHILIGLFTVGALLAILGFALWLGQASAEREYTYYEVGFDRAVSGLSEGSGVLYSGIKVGDVVSLALDNEDPRHVRARIRVIVGTPIKEDTRAMLELANITGGMVVQLHGGSPESPRLEGDEDNPPLILGDPSPFSALISDSEAIVGNLNRFLERAADLFSEQNSAKVSQILDDVSKTTQMLSVHSGELGEGLVAMERMLTQTGNLVETLNQLLDDDGRQVLNSARETLHNLSQLVDDNRNNLDRGLQAVGDLGPAMVELRNTLRTLQRVAEQLDANATEFLFGSDQIQEYRP